MWTSKANRRQPARYQREQRETEFTPMVADAAEAASLIDRYTTFDGTFRCARDLRIEGEVKGTISCQGRLVVAQGASVAAEVDASRVDVAGELNGEVRCRERLQVEASGRVRGKVATPSLVVQEGAIYEGQLEMAKVAQKPAVAPAIAGATPVAISAARPSAP